MYTATLFDCPVSDAARREAESLFSAAIEAALGGEPAVVQAHAAYQAAFDAHGELPLPAGASDAERAAVARWESAEAAGHAAAFLGWHRVPDSAHFEITA